MTFEFLLCVGVLFLLAGIGAPIAYAILVAVLVYLFATGQGLGVAGKILMDGLYQSFILLAVPLFIVAANIMNAGTISDRLLSFCVALVGRFRGGMGHVNVVASLIFSTISWASNSVRSSEPVTLLSRWWAPSTPRDSSGLWVALVAAAAWASTLRCRLTRNTVTTRRPSACCRTVQRTHT